MASGIILLPGKDKPIKQGHHWVFSGAIKTWPQNTVDGNVYPVYNSERELLGHAYVNTKTSIGARMIAFGKADWKQAIRASISSAVSLRKQLFDNSTTNSYRLINGEGDNIPGLIVDKYNQTLVMQISTLGIDKLRDVIVGALINEAKPLNIYEKSDMGARSMEGLQAKTGWIYGKPQDQISITENGHKFIIKPETSHKTGFYLDQREMRALIGKMSPGKKVLNCFSYTGGFSIYAAQAGATAVTSVDVSQEVIDQCIENFTANNLDTANHIFAAQDAFEFLDQEDLSKFDIIILDPPAFAKKKVDIENATRGYKALNKLAFKNMKSGSFLLTCSCSYHINQEMFEEIIWQAALHSGKKVRIVGKHRHAADHALNIFNPEQDYLKSLLLYID